MIRKILAGVSFVILVLSATSPVYAAAPSAPANIVIKAGTTQAYGSGTLEISWDAVSGAVAYGVRIKKQVNGTTAASETVDGEQNTKITFDKLEGGTTYIVQVNAVNALRELSTWSSDTLTAVPKTAPQAPSKPTVVTGVRKVTVSWIAIPTSNNGGFEISSYLVKEINSSKTVSAAGTATSIEVTGLSNGADVEFTVAAVNAANTTGSVSENSTKYTLGDLPSTMTAPVIAATTTTTEARVSWQAPASDGGSSLISFSIKLIKNGVDLLTQVVETISDTAYTFTSVGDSVLSPISGQLTLGASASASATPTAAPSATTSATPSASAPPPSPSPTPTPTPTPTPVTAPPSGGSSGGGFFGGGGGGVIFLPPAVAALGTPSPSPSVTPTFSPTPLPSISQLPVVTLSPTPIATKPAITSPKPSPIASVSSSPSARPGVTTNARGEVTKTTTFSIPTKVTGPVKSLTLTGSKATISTSLKNSVQPSIPSVKKGTVIKVVIKGSDGKSYTVASTTVKKTGTYKAPAIKFSKPGTYQVTVMIGKVKKVITYKITK